LVRAGSSDALPGDRSLSPLGGLSPRFFFLRERIMFGVGYQEMIIVLIVVFILFGHRLPSVMRSLGRGVVEFKQGMAGIEDESVKDEKKDV
jgi:sec-independent protein translocase protein TatA